VFVACRAVFEAGQFKEVPQSFLEALLFKDTDMKDKDVTAHISFQIFAEVIVQIVNFWVVTPCSLLLFVF
jgi:hypothetical protein